MTIQLRSLRLLYTAINCCCIFNFQVNLANPNIVQKFVLRLECETFNVHMPFCDFHDVNKNAKLMSIEWAYYSLFCISMKNL